MVIDSSAILAILLGEPERESFLQKLSRSKTKLVSAATLLEMSMVATSHGRAVELTELLTSLRVTVVPFDTSHAHYALIGFERYGRGRHKAGLNLGDCLTYGLAKQTGLPLLFKGNDFSQTDLPFA